MPTDRSDAILDSAGLVRALVDHDAHIATAALDAGDTREMCKVLAGWLADAVRCLDQDRAALVLANLQALGDRPGGGWAEYDGDDGL